jgi:hypothetical protein
MKIIYIVILKEFGMNKKDLYETIATTISYRDKKKIPNAASIGIRIINDDLIQVKSYLHSQTYKNIKKNKVIAFNLIEDVYQFALASLKCENNIELKGIPNNQFLYFTLSSDDKTIEIPYLKNAWGLIFCNLYNEREVNSKDTLGRVIASEFQFKVLEKIKLKESFKIFNRAENLALEVIILATRIKVAKENKNEIIYSKISEKIQTNIDLIEKLSSNDKILKTINLVKKFINFLENY